MNIMQFSDIQQLLQDYWWLPLCPGAALWLLPPFVRVMAGVSALVAIICVLRSERKKAAKKVEPVLAEIIKEAA